MKEAQQVVAEKTSALEAEAYKTKRLHVSALACLTSYIGIIIHSGGFWLSNQNLLFRTYDVR